MGPQLTHSVPPELIIAVSLEPAWNSFPKNTGYGAGGNPNPAGCLGLGREISLHLDPKPNSNSDPDPNPNPNHNPDIALSLIPKFCCSFHSIRWILCFLPCWKWENLRTLSWALTGELDRGEGSDQLWSPSPSWQVLEAAGPALSVRRCGHYLESVNPKSLHIKPRNHETWVLASTPEGRFPKTELGAVDGFPTVLFPSSHPSVVLQGEH